MGFGHSRRGYRGHDGRVRTSARCRLWPPHSIDTQLPRRRPLDIPYIQINAGRDTALQKREARHRRPRPFPTKKTLVRNPRCAERAVTGEENTITNPALPPRLSYINRAHQAMRRECNAADAGVRFECLTAEREHEPDGCRPDSSRRAGSALCSLANARSRT